MKKIMIIGLVLLSTLLGSIAQVLFKIISNDIFNYYLGLAVILYFFGFVFYMYALKNGALSFIFPLLATSYIWVSLLSFYFLHESFGFLKVFGILFILVGVGLIGGGKID